MEEVPKRKGRMRRWPQGERRIPPIKEGRMRFQPGDPHHMDKQVEEARKLRLEIVDEVEQLQQMIVALAEMDDPGVLFSRQEAEIEAKVWPLYRNRKHRDHLYASFVLVRRRRILQRIRAARAALEQAKAFLDTDTALLDQLQQIIAESPDYLALHPGLEDNDPRRELLNAITGSHDTEATKNALVDLEQRVKLMRNALIEGNGRFEWYYVKKPEPQQGHWGPYLRWRWEEGEHRYSMNLGPVKRSENVLPDPPAL